jgi:thioesterase domain-containing protein/acyl carrier protein
VVPEPGADVDVGTIRQRVAQLLPGYMVPAVVVCLDRLPRTPSGKLDRRALPEPRFTTAPATTAPRTPLERLLCDLFAEVLDVAQVGVDDSFFSLGGHSLLVIRLAGRIRAALGVELNIQELFDAPTPAALAAAGLGGVAPTDSARSSAPLIRLRAGTGAPLFCIHPAAGVGWSYAGLLRHLGDDRPVYALQAPGLSAPGLAPNTAEELVTDYLARIRAVQPRGPYALLGWSLGGMIAHLLAVRIQADGDQVGQLALLDSYPAVPGVHDRQAADDAILRDLSEMVGQDVTGGGSGLDLDRVLKVARDNIRLCTEQPPGTFRGDALLFVATADDENDPPRKANLWRDYITGDIEVHPVDCAHSELTRPSALSSIGPVLNQRLLGALCDITR